MIFHPAAENGQPFHQRSCLVRFEVPIASVTECFSKATKPFVSGGSIYEKREMPSAHHGGSTSLRVQIGATEGLYQKEPLVL